MSECCLAVIQQFINYIIARTSYFSMRWWWGWGCPLCTKSTRLVGYL